MNSELLTVEELAEWLKVAASWIYQRTRSRGQDRLPYIKVGKYLRFEPQAVQSWLDRHRHEYQLLSRNTEDAR